MFPRRAVVTLLLLALSPWAWAQTGLLGAGNASTEVGPEAAGLAPAQAHPVPDREGAREAASQALASGYAMLGFDAGASGLPGRVLDAVRGTVLGSRHTPRFREWAGADMKPATAWPLSQLLAAELDLAILGGDPGRAALVVEELEHYRVGGAYAPEPVSRSGKSQVRYFDDNAWLGLDLVQAWRVTGQRRYLDRALALVPFLESGMVPGGGILWRERDAAPSLNTCANAPTMQLYLALHQATGEARFLATADALHAVLGASLRRPDGLYRDNLRADGSGSPDETIWSYNQGAALGALVQLAAADPARADPLLDQAEATGAAVLARIAAEPDWLWRQPPAFNAILFRNLLKLDLVRPDPRIRSALSGYLARAMGEARNPANGAFEQGGIGRYDGDKATGITLIDQAAMAQMLALEGMGPAELALVL